MHWLAWKMRNLFSPRRAKHPFDARNHFRPRLEALEDRVVLSTTDFLRAPLGVIAGRAFFDANTNGVYDVGELAASGVGVTLTGTTAAGAPVNFSTSTDANGNFAFFQIASGTYTVTRNVPAGYIAGTVGAGDLGGTVNGGVISQISITDGQVEANLQFAILGVPTSAISLRNFMNKPQSGNSLLVAAGTGNAAADRSVQPTTQAAAGTSAIRGFVFDDTNADGDQDAGEEALTDIEVTLTGIDDKGRAILARTRTGARGLYQFTSLRAGTYTVTVSANVDGFRPGTATPGTNFGGLSIRNSQINGIQVTTGNGANYNFGLLQSQIVAALNAVTLNAELLNDTKGPLGTASDNKTFDPTIHGRLELTGTLTRFFAKLNDGNEVSISGNLAPDGRFILNLAKLKEINGGTLPDGEYTLFIKAIAGTEATKEIVFTLDTAAPVTPTGEASLAIDGDADGVTTAEIVTLEGKTSAGASVILTLPNGTKQTTTADVNGDFTFENIQLTHGSNAMVVHFVDEAGNIREFRTVFQRKLDTVSAPNVTANAADADKLIDMNSIFTDNDQARSLIRFNTTAGPIYVEFFDADAPITVRNFFAYLDAGRYDDVIFHRLATNFVLQGGGFTFETTPNNSFASVTTFANIANEFSTEHRNLTGTLSMAQSSSPSSANSQWFFNLVDNPSLDGSLSNGTGFFTVFGRVASGEDQRILNTLAAFNVSNRSSTNSNFSTFPTRDYTGTNFPTDVSADKLAMIDSFDVIYEAQELTYSVQTNSNSSVVQATIERNQLRLNYLSAGTSNITIRATDETGGFRDVTFQVGITNSAPTNINLSKQAVPVGSASGTVVGTLTAVDADASDTFTFTLVSGDGDTDNTSFQIVGSELRTNAVLADGTYSVRVQVQDPGGLTFQKTFSIAVKNAPTDITLSNASVPENSAVGTLVGTLDANDLDSTDFTYTLVSGSGSTDNANFEIVGDELRTKASFNFESKSVHSIRVQVADPNGLTFVKVFSIAVSNVNEAPVNIILSNASVAAASTGVGAAVGTLSATDPDSGDTFIFTLVPGTGDTGNDSFQIVGTALQTKTALAAGSYSIRVQVADAGGLLFPKEFTITITV